MKNVHKHRMQHMVISFAVFSLSDCLKPIPSGNGSYCSAGHYRRRFRMRANIARVALFHGVGSARASECIRALMRVYI